MGLTRKQILDIDTALAQIAHIPGDPLFVLAVAQLSARLAPHVDAIRERGRVADDLSLRYLDYEAARLELSREWALKDDSGNPVVDATHQFVFRSATEFGAELRILQQAHPYREAYEAVEAHKADWTAWAAQAATELGDDPLPLLPFDRLPPQVTPAHLQPLLPVLTGLPETTAAPA